MGHHRHRRAKLLPWRFGMFLMLTATMAPLVYILPSVPEAMMAGFDIAALAFLATLGPILRSTPDQMRELAIQTDANRRTMLIIAVAISLIIMIAVGSEFANKASMSALQIFLVIATLLIAWIFSNMVFTLHYAHLYYLAAPRHHHAKAGVPDAPAADAPPVDSRGATFPNTPEPVYWDFIYFAFTLGMTFQTSDTSIDTMRWRRVVVLHSFGAFIFNLGVIAFSINLISGSG